KVVQRVQQAAPEREDQLSIHRIGRRHPPALQRHGVLRRQRRPDDQRSDPRRRLSHPPPADGPRRRGAGLQHSRRRRGAALHRTRPRRHLPRQNYALQNKIAYGAVRSLAGPFVRASTQTVSNAAAVAAKSMPRDFRVSITNAPGKDVYPISSFTWLLVQESPKDVQRSKALADFIRWALTDGQRFAPELGYAPLPKEIVALEMEALKRVRQ